MAVMTGMLDDSEIDSAAIMQGIGRVLEDELGFLPDAVVILRAPDGQCRTFYAATPETMVAEGPRVRRTLTTILEQALKQNRSIHVGAPRRL
jgi:hypothetical protein